MPGSLTILGVHLNGFVLLSNHLLSDMTNEEVLPGSNFLDERRPDQGELSLERGLVLTYILKQHWVWKINLGHSILERSEDMKLAKNCSNKNYN